MKPLLRAPGHEPLLRARLSACLPAGAPRSAERSAWPSMAIEGHRHDVRGCYASSTKHLSHTSAVPREAPGHRPRRPGRRGRITMRGERWVVVRGVRCADLETHTLIGAFGWGRPRHGPRARLYGVWSLNLALALRLLAGPSREGKAGPVHTDGPDISGSRSGPQRTTRHRSSAGEVHTRETRRTAQEDLWLGHSGTVRRRPSSARASVVAPHQAPPPGRTSLGAG